MNTTDTHRALDYFKAKVEFSTGPVELKHMLDVNDDIKIIDVRYPADYAMGHIPGSINLPSDQWDNLDLLSQDKTNIIYCYSGVCHLAASAALHLSRTVCRRAERLMAVLADTPGEEVSAPALKYVNRLSDFLFVAARWLNDKGAGDVLWQPGQNR